MLKHTSETREHGRGVPDVREHDERRAPKNREPGASVTENGTEPPPKLADKCRLPGAPQFVDAAARYLRSRPAQSRQGAANQRRSESGFHRAVQRGASYVEHLVLIGILALALIGAFRGLQQAYAKLSSDEGKAIATFEWSRSTGESAGSALQAPNDSGEPDPKDSDNRKKCDGWWDCAKEHTKDFFVEFGKAAKDDVVGMVTGTVTLVHNLVTNPKGVYDDAKALVDAIREDPVGALKQLVWDEESSKLWASGDYGGAIGRTFWNVGSNFIPYGGQAAKVSKISKLAKAAEKVSDAAKAAEKAKDAAKAADKAGDAAKGADKASDGAKAGDKARDGSKTAEHGAEKVDDAKKTPDNTDGAEKRADNSNDEPECEGGVCKAGQKCFAAGTLVLTEAGNRPIESLKAGDLVWSRDERGGEMGLRPIRHVFVTPNKFVLNLAVGTEGGSENLTVTPGHPFWVEGTGWVPSDELAEGATLWSPEGLRHVRHGAPSTERITVYNLEVEGFHTYFVGKLHTWVHNQTTNECSKPGSQTGNPSWLSPDWGRNRVVKELHKRGFTLKKPTREGGGLIYENAAGDQIRIMPKPKGRPSRSSPKEKWENDYYYRYKPADGPNGAGRWGKHTTIPNKH